jgi:hypothetical protein
MARRQNPNGTAPQAHINIHDNGLIFRLREEKLVGSMTRWAWDQRGRPVYNFKSDGRDFSNSERCLILTTRSTNTQTRWSASPSSRISTVSQ